MRNHTPGPWTIDLSKGSQPIEITAEGRPELAYVPVGMDDCDNPEDFANARLIAAAPDLLAAVEAALQGIAERKANLTQSRNVEQILVNAFQRAKGE